MLNGNWGDLLVCIIPVSWCANILINSNFILKLIEWQTESSLFTIRIRGRQWYWIYKYDLKNFTDILSAPKNIGRNKWQINTFGDLKTSDDYLHILQLRSQSRWIKKYWDDLLIKPNLFKKYNIVSPQEQFQITNKLTHSRILLTEKFKKNVFFNLIKEENLINDLNFNSKFRPVYSNSINNYEIRLKTKKKFWQNYFDYKNNFFFNNITLNLKISLNDWVTISRKKQRQTKNNIWNTLIETFSDNNQINQIIQRPNFDENSRWAKRNTGIATPIRIIKYPLTNELLTNALNEDNLNLFRVRFNTNPDQLKQKPIPHSTFLTLKQKKYKIRKTIKPYVKFVKDETGQNTKKIKYSGNFVLKNNAIFSENNFNPTDQYNLIKKNKTRDNYDSVVLSRRLLRTKKTLVLPAHVNITAITNSYDVVHSWFIPGLGLKLDCVPGRATHHTFYIDNVGFYYGQCAEVCGRYHHHMPIRVCALPFEHFLVWWHSFGIPKLLFTTSKKKYEATYAFRKFIW